MKISISCQIIILFPSSTQAYSGEWGGQGTKNKER